MNIVNLIISILSGIGGGNAAGAAMKEKGLGAVGNSVSGAIGGGIGGGILQLLGLFNQPGAQGIDFGSILSNIGSGGVGGAILMAIVGFIKSASQKK